MSGVAGMDLLSTPQITGPQSIFVKGICKGGRGLMLPQFDDYRFAGCHDPGRGCKPGIQKAKTDNVT